MTPVHNRRARPTLRVLREDLTSGWESPQPLRRLDAGDLGALHPFSELPHPIVTKAVESFGPDPAHDNYVEPIHCCTQLRLLEIRNSQWRGGVWEDPESGVRWLLVAGLAKGNHEDHDDFYKIIERENASGDPRRWLPTREDLRLLKRETAARLRTDWELVIQRQILDSLRDIHDGGTCRIHIDHPVPGQGDFAYVDLSIAPVREDGYEADEVELDIVPRHSYIGTALLWGLTLRVLISISPPEQGWDRDRDTYSNIGEPGAWTARVVQLGQLDERGELAASVPGSTSHYTHRRHLADDTINGTAVRALCGAFFVPTQDHQSLPACPTCQERLAELPE